MKGFQGGLVGFVAAAVFLAFVAGGMVVLAEIFPSQVLRDAYLAGKALIAQKTEYDDPFTTDLWAKARTADQGVTLCERGQVLDGYTLYTSGDGPYARLIGMDGRIAHEWRRPFSEVWDESAAVRDPQPDELIYMDMARLLPNGDLLAIYTAAGDTPWGYGMVKLDRGSQVIWRYLEHTHHDFDVAADGRIFALIHSFTSEAIEGFDRLERPRLADYLVIVSADGEELRRISLTHALAKSRFKSFLHSIPAFAVADPLHANAVEVITPETAANFPFGKPGQAILSFREPGTVAVLDLEAEEIVWAMRGSWVGQHDPSLLPNGHILLFDNLGRFEAGNASRILEIDPVTMAIAWSYRGTPDAPLDSAIRSSVERLPNGNTLIDESDGGRLLEVTAEGRIVWEYLNPVRAGDRDGLLPVVSSGRRIDPAWLDAEFREILEPAATTCGAAQAGMDNP